MGKIFLILAVSVLLYSCNNKEDILQKSDTQKNQIQDTNENESDTAMTVEESFSSALVQDILGEDEDADLQDYLENNIYPLISKSDKVTIDRISSSLYLLSFNERGTMKSFIIQKFYNPLKDEFVFEKRETELNSLKQFVK